MKDIAVYVGAGTDIKPIILFKQIDTFIYIDSQPLTEFGNVDLEPEYERPEFPDRINRAMTKLGFRKISQIKTNLHEYFNPKTGRTLKYYMNCCFPKNLPQSLLKDIRTANILICCGYDPSASLIAMMKPGPKTFIGDNKTCYHVEIDEDHYVGVIKALRERPSLMKNYIRFDIPKGYPYWLENYVEESHSTHFVISSYKSIQELYDNRINLLTHTQGS